MKTIELLLAIFLLLIVSSSPNVIAQEWSENWDDEAKETTELANIGCDEAERFRKLFSISNEFDASIFASEVIYDDDDIDSGVQDHGRKFLQAANILDDQNALLQFKHGISLDPNGTLQGWNTSANQDHCAWTGVICSNVTTRVIGLNLTGVPGSKLMGTINRNISLLSSLMSLTLTQHFLTGRIPVELGSLKNLKLLNLHDNNLTGSIPPQLSSCALLETLDVGANNLTGSLPRELVQCTHLVKLDVSSNNLVGEIHANFGTLHSLSSFLGMHNGFTGVIPESSRQTSPPKLS